MNKFKLLSTTAVFVLMLLSTGAVFADGDEEPAVELPRMVVNGQLLPPMSWEDLQLFIARLQIGDNVIDVRGSGSGSEDEEDTVKGCSTSDNIGRELAGSKAASAAYGKCLTDAGRSLLKLPLCGLKFAAGKPFVHTWPDGSISTFEITTILVKTSSVIEVSCDG
ncbi:MAG: hypothetical protein L3J24_09865 [Xanthomonadales bacterium]|nr:hypothetical protein [Xanthomonadales bacterium]